ncbi:MULTISPECIES: acyl-CoA dehydrogenase family protein [unclassified Nocardioides]|uniref:acyl-CoA dehydrogenase family protein n=1 Tax=unclassified Nocardioides TaxID=2615069 RepID=UPI0009EFCC1D|nr:MULTISPECIES: acyl-CoA dehydrogenase family protein [unclassified Nocardioides]GAW48340.1 acyl-CoA dehydrogenase domain-containing protein [Nocardioides sp. PD653-B2]GAW53265.1 acyl-CoA dehydrogenase domain-containing protein [Nocardioides sp. PD653]
MSLTKSLKPGGKHGLSSTETRDPIGYAVAALSRLAQSDVLDRIGLRKQTEQAVFTATRSGFRTITAASRTFAKAGSPARSGVRPAAARATGVFDLTPTEDEQMLVDVVTEFAAEVVRPAAAEADETCSAPEAVLKAGLDIGLPILGLPESLGGISEERSAMAGALVAEALARGDLGLAVASLAPGSVATALGLWGTDAQQQTYLPAFTGSDVPAAAIALTEPTVLFDVLLPATTAERTADGYVLNGVKSAVPLGAAAELFVIGASLDGAPVLFLVESGTAGIDVVADPAMGVRAAGLTKLTLTDVAVPADAVLGATDGSTYTECVRLARLAWCALSVGTGQAVLDYVVPYVKEREAFGEPVAHRQSVAFMVADIAIELQSMRLLTWKAAARAAAGKDFAREVALARRLCADKGMQIGLDGVQLLGGHGFVKEHPVERWYRDLRAIGVMEGAVLV